MAVVHLAPLQARRERSQVLTTPNGAYMVGTPSVRMALAMIETGVSRLVFCAQEPGADWDEARRLLVRAGIRIEGSWRKTSL